MSTRKYTHHIIQSTPRTNHSVQLGQARPAFRLEIKELKAVNDVIIRGLYSYACTDGCEGRALALS